MNDKLEQILQVLTPTTTKTTASYDESQKRMQNIINNLQDSNPIKSLNRIEDSLNSPNMQKEILELIEKVYFQRSLNPCESEDEDEQNTNERDTSIVEYEIRKFKTFNKNEIKNTSFKLQIQLQIVSRKMSDLILENSPKCSEQLQNVRDLEDLLDNSNNYCLNARYALKSTQNKFTLSCLGLFKSISKKKNLIDLLNSMYTIKSLKEDFPKAIELCLQCQSASNTYEHFKCIRDMKTKMHDRLDMIEESLDMSISKICQHFDRDNYLKILKAYELLGKSQIFADQLNMHFSSVLNNVSMKCILNFINNAKCSTEELKCKEYSDLCELVNVEDYETCLVKLCLNLWNIMKNFYDAFLTHNEYIDKSEAKNEFEIKYIRQKFEHGKLRIWQDVQNKVNVCFRSMRLQDFKFDDFMRLIEILNRLMEIGQEFCDGNGDCQTIVNATKDQTLAYFKAYHISRLEELKMFLENEVWVCCPVKSNFTIMNLHEYKFLRQIKTKKLLSNTTVVKLTPTKSSGEIKTASHHSTPPPRPPPPQLNDDTKHLSAPKPNKFILDLFPVDNPFNLKGSGSLDHQNDMNEYVNGQSYDDEDEDDEGYIDNVNEIEGECSDETSLSIHKQIKPKYSNGNGTVSDKMPLLTNTTLNVVRLFGKYLQMSTIFRIISFDVIVYMMELFYFYFYYIYINFAKTEVDTNTALIGDTLQNLLENIKNDLFNETKTVNEPTISNSIVHTIRTRDDYLSCLKERFVAAESLVFLAAQIEKLFPYFNDCLTETSLESNKAYIDQYTFILKHINEIRLPIYMYIARYAIDYITIYDKICKVNWDLNDIMSEHNKYIDLILQQIECLIKDVNTVKLYLPITKQMLNCLLECCVKFIMRMLVDGYTQAKKCTNEGRALMQLDFQQLLVKLDKICEFSKNKIAIPDKDYVELYIKAYYLPEITLEKWLKEHNEYNSKQIISLLNVMAHLTRKTRASLISLYENLN